MKTAVVVFILSAISLSSVSNASDKHPLVDHHFTITSDSLYNDYTEARYDEVVKRFIAIMQPRVAARGGILKIQTDWTDGAVNAWAWREGEEYWIEAPGGAARYYLINEEAFLATLCHELGHLMGGSPSNHEISYEGQSDYYSSAKCLRFVLREIEPFKEIKPSPEVTQSCSGLNGTDEKVCQRSVIGALSLTSYYAQLEKSPAPQISTPSPERVSETLRAHPKAQCRFDTYLAGALCSVSKEIEFSQTDWRVGACHSGFESEHSRPACWYREASR